MRKLGKILLILLLGLVVLAAAVVMGINLYVQSSGMHAYIREKLEEELKVPLQIQRISFTPWGGLQLAGITVPAIEKNQGKQFLTSPRFGADLNFWAIFSGRIVIEEVALHEPTVVWTQDAEGKWKLPKLEKSAPMPMDGKPEPENVPPAVKLPKVEKVVPEETARVDVKVKFFRIKNGSFQFYDRENKLVASFAGVEVKCPVVEGHHVEGRVICEKISIHERVFLHRLNAPFVYANEELALNEFEADIAKGKIEGSFQIAPDQRNAPYTSVLRFKDIALDQLIMESGVPYGNASGTMFGAVSLQGEARNSDAMEGKGDIRLEGGEMRYDLFRSLGEVLHIEEFFRLKLKQSNAAFHIEDEKIFIDAMVMESANLKLDMKGKIKFSGKLDIDAVLTINQNISRQLPEFVERNFTENDDDTRSVEFEITGSTEKPKTNLANKILGREIGDKAIDLLQGLFFKSSKKEKDKER